MLQLHILFGYDVYYMSGNNPAHDVIEYEGDFSGEVGLDSIVTLDQPELVRLGRRLVDSVQQWSLGAADRVPT